MQINDSELKDYGCISYGPMVIPRKNRDIQTQDPGVVMFSKLTIEVVAL